ncbi:cytochrome P450 [Amylocarpus encephaloides]|uniref:Cytochrome P450 n=1 Tax=Amylocarpus encephaloides TaxID=45428 RepID=A0A9P7YFT8_9HELO|nr:cytochrome P450 [Amylocarpus encephaloides]
MPSVYDRQVEWPVLAVVTVSLYLFSTVVYRLYFSPLAKFPGPRLAAATLMYEAYYDVVKQGQYTFKIKELHKKYGPIVRISPYELHVDDPEFYDELMSRTSPRDKYKYYVDQFGIPKSSFSTIDHRLHRMRRQPLNPLFSKQSIFRLEPTINGLVEKLCSRFDEFKKSGQPIPLRIAYSCFTTDVVTLYSLNKCWNFLDDPEFSPVWCATIKATADMGNLMKHVPWLFGVIMSLPDAVISIIFPDMMLLINWRRSLTSHIQAIIDGSNEKGEKDGDGLSRTVFHSLLESDIPAEEKTLDRLVQEGQVVVGAGADTTAHALTTTTFHLLDNPDKLAKLRRELEIAMPDRYAPAKLSVVEQLPYLAAVINEGLRLSYGLSTRLARVSPKEELRFKEWTIPIQTPVGMTSVMMHHNETIFPDSYSFIPERWSEQPDGGRSLEKYLVSFAKGTRQCIGMNLARAELFLALATIFRRYDLDLYDTKRARDIDLRHDNFLPQASLESRGVRVVIKG